jgi:ankyrin repeat protein
MKNSNAQNITQEQQELLNLCLLRAVLPASYDNLKPKIISDLSVAGIDLDMEKYVWGANVTDEDELIKQILEKGADVTSFDRRAILEIFNRQGLSKSFFLIFNRLPEEEKSFVQAAIENNAQIIEEKLASLPYLHDIALKIAVTKGSLNALKILVKDLASDIENIEDLFLEAADLGDVDLVKFFLQKGVNINSVDERGNTALNLAVQRDRVKVVDFLLESGADINIANHSNFHPITTAITSGSEYFTEILLDRNAIISQRTIEAFQQLRTDYNKNNNHDRTNLIVLTRGAINLDEDSRNRLFLEAAKVGQIGVLNFLLDSGVDVNTISQEGYLAISLATFHCKPEVVKTLLKRGAEIDENIFSSVISANQTWIEARGANLGNELRQIVTMILSSGLDLSLEDDDRQSEILSLLDRESATFLVVTTSENVSNLIMRDCEERLEKPLNATRISKLKEIHNILKTNIGKEAADLVLEDLAMTPNRTQDLSNYFIEISARHTSGLSDPMNSWVMNYSELNNSQNNEVYKVFRDFFIPPRTKEIFIDQVKAEVENFRMGKEDVNMVEKADFADKKTIPSTKVETVKKKSALDIRNEIRESRRVNKSQSIDFGRETPLFSVHGNNDVLTRPHQSFLTPSNRTTRPSKYQHGDAISLKEKDNKSPKIR